MTIVHIQKFLDFNRTPVFYLRGYGTMCNFLLVGKIQIPLLKGFKPFQIPNFLHRLTIGVLNASGQKGIFLSIVCSSCLNLLRA